jgi:phosphoglycolate phosphatase
MNIAFRANPINAVLFDLDGTLIHTVPDIAEGINRMLAGLSLRPVSEAEVTLLMGRGGPVLVERVFGLVGVQVTAAVHGAALQAFLHHYEDVVGRGARLYPGVLAAFEELRCMGGLKLAVVTNNYHRFTTRLLRQFNLSPMIDLVVGGDTLAARMPDPLLYACDSLGVAVSEAIYVGGSLNDVEAACRAGMPVYCVPYGYNEGQPAASLGCNGPFESIAEVVDLVRGRPRQKRSPAPLPELVRCTAP